MENLEQRIDEAVQEEIRKQVNTPLNESRIGNLIRLGGIAVGLSWLDAVVRTPAKLVELGMDPATAALYGLGYFVAGGTMTALSFVWGKMADSHTAMRMTRQLDDTIEKRDNAINRIRARYKDPNEAVEAISASTEIRKLTKKIQSIAVRLEKEINRVKLSGTEDAKVREIIKVAKEGRLFGENFRK